MRLLLTISFLLCLGLNGMAQSKNLCPDNKHPHMIDLGLPSGTKWACCNIGSSNPHEYGNFYAWGESYTKSKYGWENYSYGSSVNSCRHLGYDIAGSDYDVAARTWHSEWRMPDIEQIKELNEKCKSVWTTRNGVKGALITGPNGHQIFLPAAGCFCMDEQLYAKAQCLYWSSTQSTLGNANCLSVNYKLMSSKFESRFYGMPVRPVVDNEQCFTFWLKDKDGLTTSVKIDLNQEIVTLFSRLSPKSIHYKRCFLDVSEDEKLSDLEKIATSKLVFSTAFPAQQSNENLVNDILEGKHGDCCMVCADALLFLQEKGQKELLEPKNHEEYLQKMIDAILMLINKEEKKHSNH
ncbi:MAG: hypothetical protein IKH19_03600 [Muribaculaceae bacterium]|nr:hypothetical protein [Muribaculaceae bacterium]